MSEQKIKLVVTCTVRKIHLDGTLGPPRDVAVQPTEPTTAIETKDKEHDNGSVDKSD